jgi:tripartite-type tricarboxylate transporter receptor subunit TctC
MTVNVLLRHIVGIAVAGALMACATVHAQAYPSRPIKMIVPYAAGGFSDQATRILTEGLSRALGQPIVVDNRAGGGGRIGSDAVSKMTPDGYQLLMTTNGTHTYMAVTEKNLSYDPVTDFTPVSLVGSSPEQLVQTIRTETDKLRAIAAGIPGGIQ